MERKLTKEEDSKLISFHSHRGTIALRGTRVDAIAAKWCSRCPDAGFAAAQRGREDRDGCNYHITVITPSEAKQTSASALSCDYLNSHLGEIELFDFGVGKCNGCYYVVVLIPKLQKLRKQFNLDPLDLHITLGFSGSDVHGSRKDVRTLLPGAGEHTLELCCTAEKLLHAASSSQGRAFFHYLEVAKFAMRQGYLFGSYYTTKYLFQDPTQMQCAHDALHTAASAAASCRRLEQEAEDYGALVCHALNHNIYAQTSYHRLRTLFESRVEVCSDGSRYAISAQDMPRNFSFVSGSLAGSSIVDSRRHFESMVALGITDVITVMEQALDAPLYKNLPLRYHFFAVADRTPPTMQQMKQMVAICDSEGAKVLVHCLGGVGRTATVLAAQLMWAQGLSRAEAKQPLLEHRKTILSGSQDAFLSHWYEECLRKEAAGGGLPAVAAAAVPSEKLPPVIMCIGFPSSGKSAFSSALGAAFPGRVTRINQDERGRSACETMAGALSKRKHHTVILDRCNLTKKERKEWLGLAHNQRAWALVFTAPLEECQWRIVRRTNHPTIRRGGGARILAAVADTIEAPAESEGFEKIISIPSFDACNMLLQQWGCAEASLPVSSIPAEEGMLKFPRTRHVQNMGGATRDDLVMTPQEVAGTWLHHELFVEEKIDGANM
jgi:predicted protein tyrosine phosphatase